MNIIKNGFLNNQTEALIREGAFALHSIATKSDAASVVFTGLSCVVVHETFSNMLSIKADDPHILAKKCCIVIADVTSALVNMRVCTVFTAMSYQHALCISIVVVAAVMQRIALFSLEMSKKAPPIENQNSESLPDLELEEQEPTKSLETLLLEAISTPIPKQLHSAQGELDSLDSFSAIPVWPKNKNPQDYLLTPQLANYCKEHAESVKEEKVVEFIIKGADFAYKLRSGKDMSLDPATGKPLSETQVEETLAAYFWYLMAIASEKNQAFTEGSIAIPDLNRNLFKFLEKVMPKAYERRCSHLYTVRKGVIGVNIEKIVPALPGKMGHLLFIEYENDDELWVLIKPEPAGFDPFNKPLDAVQHAYHYLFSVGRKILPSMFGSDHEEGMRKERTPIELLKKWHNIAKTLPNYTLAAQVIGDHKGNGEGFKAIYRHVKSWIPRLAEKKDARIHQFIEFLKELEEVDSAGRNKYDYPERRVGTETIIMTA